MNDAFVLPAPRLVQAVVHQDVVEQWIFKTTWVIVESHISLTLLWFEWIRVRCISEIEVITDFDDLMRSWDCLCLSACPLSNLTSEFGVSCRERDTVVASKSQMSRRVNWVFFILPSRRKSYTSLHYSFDKKTIDVIATPPKVDIEGCADGQITDLKVHHW